MFWADCIRRLLILERSRPKLAQSCSSSSGFWLGDLKRHVIKHFSLFTLTSVTRHAFVLVKLFLSILIDSLMNSTLMFFGWSVLSSECQFMAMFSSLMGTIESKKVSEKHTTSKLRFLTTTLTNVTLKKLWAASLLVTKVTKLNKRQFFGLEFLPWNYK